MDYLAAMAALEAAGTEQNRKVYGRHGVTGPMFGVSYASLGKLVKQIRCDHDLALALWQSGNHDARMLATMVADPERIAAKTIEAWAKDLHSYVVTDAFAKLVARSPHADACMEAWMKAKNDWICAAGWSVFQIVAVADPARTDSSFDAVLARIENEIHGAGNRSRYAMNGALIAIGMRSAGLEKRAIAAAKRIGPVEVDHGDTGCKTPDAATYIPKARAHAAGRAAKAKTTPKKAPAKKKAAKKTGTRTAARAAR
jgi:3-methyladenine DNA glycosylase AlkD